jgi:hypothetical protein
MRVLALKGQVPSHSASEFSPSINLLDMGQPEYGWLRRQQMYYFGRNQAALAANFNYWALSPNFVGRAGIAVVERVIFANTSGVATGCFVMLMAQLTVGGGTLAMARDDRQNNGLNTSANRTGLFTGAFAQSATNLQASIPSQVVSLQTAIADTVQLDIPFVLTGNTDAGIGNVNSLVVQQQTVNQNGACTIVWRERAMLVSEAT